LPAPRGYDGPVAWIGLALDRTTHRAWIATRARSQFEAGLVEEAKALRERFDPGLRAFSAIGYREAWAVLDGRLDREAAIDEDSRRNASFAKRQRTWFRSEPDITWLDAAASPDDQTLAAARRLLER
jgi:tRNA dimethylallyltransferase